MAVYYLSPITQLQFIMLSVTSLCNFPPHHHPLSYYYIKQPLCHLPLSYHHINYFHPTSCLLYNHYITLSSIRVLLCCICFPSPPPLPYLVTLYQPQTSWCTHLHCWYLIVLFLIIAVLQSLSCHHHQHN